MLRDDGFPGEFLDHYMLETRFDVSGFPGAYWAAEDAEIDPLELAAALRQAARDARVAFPAARARALRAEASGVVVTLEKGSLRGAAAVVATDGPAAGLAARARAAAATPGRSGGSRSRPSRARPCRLRCARPTGGSRGSRTAATVLLAETGARPPGSDADLLIDFAVAPAARGAARPACRRTPGEVSLDGLPVVGRLPGRPLAVACGFSRLSPGLAFAAARWVADALLRGTDPTPDALRPTRTPLALGV